MATPRGELGRLTSDLRQVSRDVGEMNVKLAGLDADLKGSERNSAQWRQSLKEEIERRFDGVESKIANGFAGRTEFQLLQKQHGALADAVKNEYVRKEDVSMVHKIVWGAVFTVLVTVLGALLALIVVKTGVPLK